MPSPECTVGAGCNDDSCARIRRDQRRRDRRHSTCAERRPAVAAPKGELTAGQARRIAIAAQQLAAPLPPVAAVDRAINRGHLNRLLQAIGLLQIDSVNVLARAHLLPIFSRLGPYPYALLEGAAWPRRSADRLLVEAWAHVASLVPVGIEPLLRWRQQAFAAAPWARVDAVRRDHPGFLDTVLAVIDEQGPMSAGDIEKALEAPGRGISGWWEWSITKTTCEYLFATGAIGVAYRRGFERCYDLMDRVLPAAVLATPTPIGGRRQTAVDGAGRPPPRHRDRVRPGRLLPDQTDQRPAGAGRAGRGGRAHPGAGAGLDRGRLSAPGRPRPAQGGRGGAAVPVRPADLGTGPDRAAVRLPLPDRDLHPTGEAAVRVLRLPVAGR